MTGPTVSVVCVEGWRMTGPSVSVVCVEGWGDGSTFRVSGLCGGVWDRRSFSVSDLVWRGVGWQGLQCQWSV